MNNRASPKKTLSVFSLVMINVIAVDSLRTLPISAEYGFSLVFYYFLAAFIFFIPIALVAAELATGWPQKGGLYVWVREAFGQRLGFLTIWLQWIYNVVWYPTILAFIASAIAYLFAPALANDKTFILVTVLITFWIATLVNCFGMKTSSIVSTIGAILGTLAPIFFIVCLAIYWIYSGKTIYITPSWSSLLPDFSKLGNLVLFTGVLFGLIGMEMSAVHADEVRNPQRDYPRALYYSTLLIFSTLVLGSLSIAMVVPQKQLSLVSGLIDAFGVFFQAYNMQWMTPLIAMLIIIGGFSGVSAWIIGPTKGLLIAAQDGALPSIFAKTNRFGAPTAILILQGLIFSALCSVFVLMQSINESYWILSAMTAQLALLVYVFMFAAVIKLRYSKPKVNRSYRIPGGLTSVWLVAGLGMTTCLVAIFLGFIPPSQFSIGNLWFYEGFLVGGSLLFALLPWLLYRGPKNKDTDC